ncbi:hypothetical protein O3P69_020341 [Scylla paramamosain]|uniref:Uncharacterized protein n=1 Tax=Scylla paramamosain TaxID=85552 RepID=A0AAW0TLC4_SCYPA
MVTAAPLPASSSQPSPEENLIEAHEEGLLLLVPTLPADEDKNGKDLKREVEYELISIPKEVLRREIRQVAELYGTPRYDHPCSAGIVVFRIHKASSRRSRLPLPPGGHSTLRTLTEEDARLWRGGGRDPPGARLTWTAVTLTT